MSVFDTNNVDKHDDSNDKSPNIVETSDDSFACDEELQRSGSTSTWGGLHSSQDDILSKQDCLTHPTTGTNSDSSTNITLLTSSSILLPEDVKIRLAIQSSLAAASIAGSYDVAPTFEWHHASDDNEIICGNDSRAMEDYHPNGNTTTTTTTAITSSIQPWQRVQPKPSQQELARSFMRAYEERQQVERDADDSSRPTRRPSLDDVEAMVAFPAHVVDDVGTGAACGHESMLCLQEVIIVDDQEDEMRRRKRKRQTIVTIVVSVLFLVVVMATVFGVTFGLAASRNQQQQQPTSTAAPGVDRETVVSTASFNVKECYNDPLLPKGDVALQRHENFRLQIISQYPNTTSLIDVPYSKESVALCWLSYFDKFEQVSADEIGVVLAQRFALATLYYHFQGTPSNNVVEDDDNAFMQGKWLSALDVCNWEYVECSDSLPGTIVGLKIDAMDLTGRLPSELAMISNLQSLRFDGSLFTGEIPSEIWTLTQLELLLLGENQINGTISKEIGNLRQLTSLTLTSSLSGTIPDLQSLSKLTDLEVSSEFLVGPFPSIQGLTSLGTKGISLCLVSSCMSVDTYAKLLLLMYLCAERLMLGTPQLSGTIPSYFWSLTHLSKCAILLALIHNVADFLVPKPSWKTSFRNLWNTYEGEPFICDWTTHKSR